MNTSRQMIREYSTSDYDVVVDFMTALQVYFAKLDSTGEVRAFASQEDAKEYIDQAINDVHEMNGAIFVAEADGNIVGFIQGVIVTHDKDVMHRLTHKDGAEGWIGLLFTEPTVRGRGIGKALLGKMQEHFRSKNCTSMRLKTAHNNDLALGVYRAYGFTPRDIEMAMKI